MLRAVLLVLVGLVIAAETAEAKSSRQDPIAIKKGLPKADGLGRLAIVTNYAAKDARYKAVKAFAQKRNAKIIKFKENDVASSGKALKKAGVEFVAFAVTPESVDIQFHYEVLEMCRDLDADPMPDFHFGYLSTRDGPDMERLLAGILKRESERAEKPAAKIIALTGTGKQLLPLDYVLHFGHGQAWQVNNGMTGEQVGKLELPRAPIVWSGACFNGVLSRSYHKCAYQLIFLSPSTIDPAKLMTLNWMHAGASGYFAALEADRGEMAVAEWEYFRSTACSLGEAIGYQYRLAFTSVYADFTKFPRYIPGAKKRMGFYDVMLRGMVSRILLSDPSLSPLAEPIDKPIHATQVAYDPEAKQLVVDVKVLRFSNGLHVNYLPKSGKGIFDRRCYVRVALPAEAPAKFGEETVKTTNGPELVTLSRHHVRHEVWGGVRYLNLQAEAPAGQIKTGTAIRYTFPMR